MGMYVEKLISHKDTGFRFMKPLTLWKSRAILYHLIQRDMLITYKQTILGVFWTVLKPLVMAAIIVFVFGRIGRFPDHGLPYILIALSALAFWEFFANAVNRGAICFVDDRDLITRVNFPRIILPLNAALRNTVGLIINLTVICVFMLYYDQPITFRFLLISLIYVATVLLNFGVNLWLGTLNVFFRDVGTLVPFLLRIGLFVSPVAFTFDSVPEQWQRVYSLNPLVGIIEAMRYCVFGDQFLPSWDCLFLGSISLVFLLVSGAYFFGRNERKFADVI